MQILPSLLAAPSLHLAKSTELMLSLGLNKFHIDMMDYRFTKNFGLTPDICRDLLKTFPEITLDIHLMTQPTSLVLIESLLDMGINDISIHLNTLDEAAIKALSQYKNLRLRLAANSSDQLSDIQKDPLFSLLAPSRLLILAVTPGFCGQQMHPSALQLTEEASLAGFDTMLDGGINIKTASLVKKANPSSVVIGGGLFNHEIKEQKALINLLRDPQDSEPLN